jgi:hypothetical protein
MVSIPTNAMMPPVVPANFTGGGAAILATQQQGQLSTATPPLTVSSTGIAQQQPTTPEQMMQGMMATLQTMMAQLMQMMGMTAPTAQTGVAPTGGAATAGAIANPDPATRQTLLNAYVTAADPNSPDLDVGLMQQIAGNAGISSLALGYGAEIKAAAADIAANPNSRMDNLINRGNNPQGMLPFMQLNNGPADQFLAAMMVYKNGTYNGGVFGQYNLPNIVNTYEQLVGPLSPEAKNLASQEERSGMGLFYRMLELGVIDPNAEVGADGSSAHGFWDPEFNSAYRNALSAVTSGTLTNDLALEAAGQGDQTVGQVDAFLVANQQGQQIPFVPHVLRGQTGLV